MLECSSKPLECSSQRSDSDRRQPQCSAETAQQIYYSIQTPRLETGQPLADSDGLRACAGTDSDRLAVGWPGGGGRPVQALQGTGPTVLRPRSELWLPAAAGTGYR